jgi:hypothetical protein
MSTTTLVVALASLVASYAPDSLSWQADYSSARRLGWEEARPLAVFIGSGKAGWNQVSRYGPLGKKAKELLAKNYICVYVNTDVEAGKELAMNFDVREGPALVISDHTGSYQAFRHSGDLPSEQLVGYLNRYADPDRVVRTTETNPSERPSYFPVETYPGAFQPYYRPLNYSPLFSGGGRSC